MERYHMFKLGLAVLFYAAYCIRPMMVNGLDTNDGIENFNPSDQNYEEEYVYYQGVQGKPGVDFPVLSHIPRTSFSCKNMDSGYYADLETRCQVFHICEDEKKISFLCPNGTIFEQSELICEWWFKTNCTNSPNLYDESAEQLREDNARRKANRRVYSNENGNRRHGAVMRTEEKATVSASQNNRNVEIKTSPQRGNEVVDNGKEFVNVRVQHQRTNANVIANTKAQKNDDQYVRITGQTSGVSRNNNKQKPPKRNKVDDATETTERESKRIEDTGDQYVRIRGQTSSPVRTSNRNSGRRYQEIRQDEQNSDKKQTNNKISLNARVNLSGNLQSQITSEQNSQISLDTTTLSKNRYLPEPTTQPTIQQDNNYKAQDELAYHKNYATTQKQQDITRNNLDKDQNDSDEIQSVQETASFYKNSFNTIQQSLKTSQNPYPNHRESYTEVKKPEYYSTKIHSAISSVTPHYLTTQSINNGKPFLGSQVGSSLASGGNRPASFAKVSFDSSGSNEGKFTRNYVPESTTQNLIDGGETDKLTSVAKFSSDNSGFNQGKSTRNYVPESTTQNVIDGETNKPISFAKASSDNFGSNQSKATRKYNPESTTQNLIRTELFNVGKTESTLLPKPTLQELQEYEKIKYSVTLPPPGSFNLGKGSVQVVPTKANVETSTRRIVDHATIYGKFVKATPTPSLTETVDTNRQSKGFYVTREENGRIFDAPSSTLSPPFARSTINDISSNSKPNGKIKPRPFQLSTEAATYYTSPKFSGARSNAITPTYPTYKISSASPFALTSQKPTQPTTLRHSELPSTFDNVDNMINALVEMANRAEHETETPRPGLVIPPSAGPQTLHTLAVYFANALDGIAAEKENIEVEPKNLTKIDLEKKQLTELLTRMTMDRYNELFDDKKGQAQNTTVENESDLETQHSKNALQSPKARQLAKVFTHALSSYLDDPATFRRVLEEVRPTEPPAIDETDDSEDELLNFSDADTKRPTLPPIRPTWGYILSFNNNNKTNLDVKNSLHSDSENLQLADSQSFVSQFNKLQQSKETTTKSPSEQSNLPLDHWTSSPGVTKLWKSTFAFDPASINHNFDATEPTIQTSTNPPSPHREIKYEVRALPKLSLNSTQVHGILIDFMNTTKNDNSNNRLQRILRKLNTTEDEFLAKMREIESNPLTRRLVLLLISECGDNAAKEIRAEALPVQSLLSRSASESPNSSFPQTQVPTRTLSSSPNFKETVDPSIEENSQDSRALQLLNSLYTIASKFGK